MSEPIVSAEEVRRQVSALMGPDGGSRGPDGGADKGCARSRGAVTGSVAMARRQTGGRGRVLRTRKDGRAGQASSGNGRSGCSKSVEDDSPDQRLQASW